MDEELYEGDLLYTPVVKKWYYEVVITDIAVGGESLNLDCKKVKIIYPLNVTEMLFLQRFQLYFQVAGYNVKFY